MLNQEVYKNVQYLLLWFYRVDDIFYLKMFLLPKYTYYHWLLIKISIMIGGMAQVVECLLCKHVHPKFKSQYY
jgi:hypothetical protein